MTKIRTRNPPNKPAMTKREAKKVDASTRIGLPANSIFRLVSSNTFCGVNRVENSPIARRIGITTRWLKGWANSNSSRDTCSPRSVNSARRAIKGSSSSWEAAAVRIPTTTSTITPEMSTTPKIIHNRILILDLDIRYLHHDEVARRNHNNNQSYCGPATQWMGSFSKKGHQVFTI